MKFIIPTLFSISLGIGLLSSHTLISQAHAEDPQIQETQDPKKEKPILTLSSGTSVQSFSKEWLDSLPQHTIVTTTPWHEGKKTFKGPLLKDIAKSFNATGKDLKVLALNDFSSDIPESDLTKYSPILATSMDGEPLKIRKQGPLFVVYPFESTPEIQNETYYSKAVWQVKTIIFK